MSAEALAQWSSIIRVVVSGFEPGYWGALEAHLSPGRGFAAFVRSGSLDAVLLDCKKMSPCVWLVSEHLLAAVDPCSFGPSVGYGRDVQVLVVGAGGDDELRRRVLHLGCSGFLEKDAPPEIICKAIKSVAAGELWADRKLACQVLQESLQQSSQPALTPREREILWMITEGKTNRLIGEELHITRDTVRWHIRSLYNKIGVKDRLSAVFFARQFFGADLPVANTVVLENREPVPMRAAGHPHI